MGSGKTTVGKRLAARLGGAFVDLDEWLTDRFGPIPEQFAREGEAVFRRRETDGLAHQAQRRPAVLATGGGAWVSPKNRQILRDFSLMVVLTAPFEVLEDRVGATSGRPKWNAEARALFDSRAEAYLDADLVIDTHELSPDEVVEEIVRWIT